MEIYKIQAKKATRKARAQRVLRENAQAQRVADEQQAAAQQTIPQQNPTLFPVLEVEDSHSPGFSNTRGPTVISQQSSSNHGLHINPNNECSADFKQTI